MRVSVDGNDPGYREDAIWYDVYFNDKPRSLCVTADEDLGFIKYFVTNKNGNSCRKHGQAGELLTCTLYGDVKLHKTLAFFGAKKSLTNDK